MPQQDLLLVNHRKLGLSSTGEAVYNLEFVCTPGETPSISPSISAHVFVMNIVSVEDTTQDVFARVATIADLDLIPNTREIATASGAPQYRVSTTSLSFTDVDTALAAVPVMRDRINNLVSVYVTAMSSYVTPTSSTTYPDSFSLPLGQEEQSIKASLIQAYRDARTTRINAETAQESAQKAYADAQIVTEARREIRQVACEVASKFKAVSSSVSTAGSGLSQAVAALEKAARAMSSRTRTVLSGNVLSGVNEAIFTIEGAQSGYSSNVWQDGDLIAVTWNRNRGAGPKTEIRTILNSQAVGQTDNRQIQVGTAFTYVPGVTNGKPDTYTIRKFSDFFETNDFGFASVAADAARTILREYSDKAVSVLAAETSTTESLCATTSAALDVASDSELTAESANNTAMAEVSAVLQTEADALAKLVEYCPNLDVSTV